MRRWRSIAMLLLTCGAVTACSDVFRESYDYGSVVVRTTDAEGNGVPATRLTLYTSGAHMEYAVTGSDGRYTFRFVPAGNYGVEAGPPEGYRWPDGAVSYRYVAVQKGATNEVDFDFEALE